MKNYSRKFELLIGEQTRNMMEYFIEEVTDKLYINDTYFGNLIAATDVIVSLLIENQIDGTVTLSYITDYQSVSLYFEGVSRETQKWIKDLISKKDKVTSGLAFTLVNVTDKIFFDEDNLVLVFNIAAMNKIIYDKRKTALKRYFQGETKDKSIKSNDHFYL